MRGKKITKRHSINHNKISSPQTQQPVQSFQKQITPWLRNWGVYASTPLICTVDCLATYTATATVNIRQARNIPFSNAFKIQMKQPNGPLHGVGPFWIEKNRSRLSALALGPSLMGNNPTMTTVNLVAILTGLTETFITNRNIIKSRLRVINNSLHVDPEALKCAARSAFPLHLLKNTVTLMVAFNSNKFTPQRVTDNSPCSQNLTTGLFTGFCVTLLQLCGASHLDTIMTLQAKNSYNNTKTNMTLGDYYRYITQNAKFKNTPISLARAGIFGVSYSCTFIMMAEIKDLIKKY
jgi:hypothetical protein